MAGALFMTGATGFVGSHFLYRALCEELTVFCLVRAKNRAEGYRRLHAAVELAASGYRAAGAWRGHLANLRVVVGDITQPECGVPVSVIDALRPQQLELWHFAASLRYQQHARDAIFRDNVEGTRHALALASRLDAVRFVQLSTAYTAGGAVGLVPERLHPIDGVFRNEYERSKCQAEHEVAAWGKLHSKDVRIARPSIVVGPRDSCLPGGGRTGLYGFMQEVFHLRRTLSAAKQPLLVLGDADVPLNLVPVDRVADELLALRRFGYPFGPIYHLTSDVCPTVGRAVALAARSVGAPPLRVAARRSAEVISPIERAFDQRTRFYSSYLAGHKQFQRRFRGGGRLSDAELVRYCESFAAELRRRNPLALFERRSVRMDDGVIVPAYAVGDARRSAIVLVNAYGMAAESMVALATRLSERQRVITWRPRGLEAAAQSGEHTIARQVRDLEAILAAYDLKRVHLAGWCSGADVALAAATQLAGRTLSLTLLNGSLLRSGAVETEFQERLRSVVGGASRGLPHARIYHDVLYGERERNVAASRSGQAQTRERFAGLFADIDPELLHLTSRPFATPQALHRYACWMQAFLGELGAPWPERPLSIPTLVVTGHADRIVNPDASRIFARCMNARLLDLPTGDHFAHIRDPEVAGAMLEHVAQSRRAIARTSSDRDAQGLHMSAEGSERAGVRRRGRATARASDPARAGARSAL
ncbi:MAG: alpha/beta fold hydrolase [Polyangiales bacterium]